MEEISLLQSFALSKQGELVAVHDVERGQSCGCTCPSCGSPLIAKQGDVRVWHFAHEHGADCAGGAETALHLAAKKVIEQAGGLMYPSLSVRSNKQLPDGRCGTGEATLRETWVDFDSVQLEVRIGSVIPDVIGMAKNAMHLIEIGVTHFVDAEKLAVLQHIGLPAIELDLSQFEKESWDWAALENAVVQSTENKTWLFCPQKQVLEQQALERALHNALSQPMPHSTATPTNNRTRFHVAGRIVDLIDLPFGVALWSPYDPNFNQVIKDWARVLGGQYQPKFRNWLFQMHARPLLIQLIES